MDNNNENNNLFNQNNQANGINEKNNNPNINNINNFNQYTTNSIKPKNNNKKIIIVVVVIAVAILLLLTIFNKSSGAKNNKYTAEAGEVLKINENDAIFSLKQLGSNEQYAASDTILFDGNYIKIKFAVENPTTTALSLKIHSFELLDADKNKIADCSGYLQTDDNLILKDIASGESAEGYLYFYSSFSKQNGDYVTDYTNLNSIEYLKVSVISDAEQNEATNYSREDYYLKLK